MKKIRMTMSLMLLACMGQLLQAENVRFRIFYDEVQKQRGELYQYSERYLGVSNIVMQDETTYVLQGIKMLRNDSLCPMKKCQQPQACKGGKNCTNKATKQAIHVIPMNEEAIMAGNTSKQAESVAKQIYRIREARMSVLSGETEQAISDVKSVLKEMDRLEQDLASMFVGNTYIKHCSKVIEVEVNMDDTDDTKNLMLRFSKFAGPVEKDDMSGEPIYILRHVKTEMRPENDKKNAKKIPFVVDSNLSIQYNGQIIYNQLEEK